MGKKNSRKMVALFEVLYHKPSKGPVLDAQTLQMIQVIQH